MRVVPAVGSMRRRAMYKAMRDASITAALRQRFRIVHLSIQRTHIHMLAEADHELALARGMQGFQISAAKHINAALGAAAGQRRRGQVFADRYHVEVITSPKQARNALSYLERDLVSRLARARRQSSDVADPGDVRSARGVSAAELVVA
jgi:REP element-mobilizing transposase RayT